MTFNSIQLFHRWLGNSQNYFPEVSREDFGTVARGRRPRATVPNVFPRYRGTVVLTVPQITYEITVLLPNTVHYTTWYISEIDITTQINLFSTNSCFYFFNLIQNVAIIAMYLSTPWNPQKKRAFWRRTRRHLKGMSGACWVEGNSSSDRSTVETIAPVLLKIQSC